jgi:flavin reductase (DIM6/NTAB) family NADH-FMN oxidoreductase RutF
MELDPDSLPWADRYKLLIGAIVPRPIAFVSSISPDGRLNLAPFSFFNGIGSNPMTLLFCPVNKPDGSRKDTLLNVLPPGRGGMGEFVVNTASEPYARQMAAAAEPLPRGESEFDFTGLASAPSARVRPPRLADSPIAFECRTRDVIELNPGQPAGGNIVIGEVLYIFIRDGLMDDRFRIDQDAMRAIGRMGGPTYTRTRERFELPQGKEAFIAPGLPWEGEKRAGGREGEGVPAAS